MNRCRRQINDARKVSVCICFVGFANHNNYCERASCWDRYLQEGCVQEIHFRRRQISDARKASNSDWESCEFRLEALSFNLDWQYVTFI